MDALTNNGSTMSSMDIAAITGKNHRDILRAIRNMEPAWEKINQRKFALVTYIDTKGENRPCYSLTKTECLYIATKFNDEARAKLVIRWEQLERENVERVPHTFSEALMLAAIQQEKMEEQQKEIRQLTTQVAGMEQKVSYLDKIFSSPSTCKVKVIAQDYGMSAIAFNQLLHELGIQYRCGEQWVLYAKYIGEGYVQSVSFDYEKANGSTGVSYNTQWTQKGRFFLYDFLKRHDILPLIER